MHHIAPIVRHDGVTALRVWTDLTRQAEQRETDLEVDLVEA